MRATALIDEALVAFFRHLEEEQWGTLAERLHPEAQLADELTGDWLRGKERVAAYLRAQAGIVTDVRSDLRSGESRWITDDLGLATFIDRAAYRLEDVEHRDDLTGSALFSFEKGDWTLLLFHLGAQASVRESADLVGRPVLLETPPMATPGEALRNRRQLAGLSLRALGGRVGLSASFLSQVERGQAEPSVGTLMRLAEALEIPAGELIGSSGGARPGERVIRRGNRRRVTVPGAGAELELLSDDAAQGLEAAIVTLQPGGTSRAGPQAVEGGDRLLHVIDGEIELAIGAERVVLAPGDSFTVPAGQPYAIASGSERPLRYLTALARTGPRQFHSITERSLR